MVTGGTGFVGSHSVRAFRAAGHEVRLLVRDPAKLARVFPGELGAQGLDDWVEGDVTDRAAVERALDGCDAAFHAAAMVDMRRSMARRVIETNARAVELVVGGAAERGFRSIVYVSSMSVFFEPGCPTLTPELPIAPPATPYAQSKADAEHYVRRLQAEGAPVRVSYPVGIVGPDDPALSEANHAVYSWFRDMALETSSCFELVDVRDLAELHRVLLELPEGAHRYGASGGSVPWMEIVDYMEALTGRRIRAPRIPGPLLRGLGHVGDVVKRVVDFNFPLTADAMRYATQWPGTDASRTTDELGVVFRPQEETYRDTLRWMVRVGHLHPAQIGNLVES